MADDAGLLEVERIHQRQHVGGMLVGAERTVRLVAVAEAAQVRREQCVTIGKPRHHRLPAQPEFRPAMQQQQRRSRTGPRHMEAGAVGADFQMLHRDCSLPFQNARWPRRVPRRILSVRALSGPPSSPRTRPDRGAKQPPMAPGEVAEWSNAPHSKCGIGASLSGVRIPPSPPDVPCPARTHR